jgi:hypothetical protein
MEDWVNIQTNSWKYILPPVRPYTNLIHIQFVWEFHIHRWICRPITASYRFIRTTKTWPTTSRVACLHAWQLMQKSAAVTCYGLWSTCMSWFTILHSYLRNKTCSSEFLHQTNQAKNTYPVVSTWTLISMPEGSFVLAWDDCRNESFISLDNSMSYKTSKHIKHYKGTESI